MGSELARLLSVVIPIVSSTVLLVGIILIANIYFHHREKFYLAVILSQLTAFAFTFCNALIPIVYHYAYPLMTYHIRRYEELAINFFLFTIPFMSATLLTKDSFWHRVNKVLIIIGMTLLAIFTITAFTHSALFLPYPDFSKGITLAMAISKGDEGLLLSIRDIFMLIIFFLSLVCLAGDRLSRKNNRLFTIIIIAGLTIGLIFIAYDSFFKTESIEPVIGADNYHLYSIIAATIFALIAISLFLRDFVLKARKMEDTSIAYYKSEKKFKQFADNIDEALWIIELKKRGNAELLYINHAYEKIFKQSSEELYRDYWSWTTHIHDDERERVLSEVKKKMKWDSFEQEFELEYRIVCPDDTISWVFDRFFPIRNREGEIIRIARVSKDITRRKSTEEKLSYLAYYDPLTGLMNRKAFYERFEDSLNQAKRAKYDRQRALLFIDLHNLKQINDSLGHSYGDLLIQEATAILMKVVRRSDYVFRYGGDEFVIVLNQIGSSSAGAVVAEKIIENLSRPFVIDQHHLYLGSSIGISLFPQDGDDIETLIKKSSTALHQAKREKNTYKYYTEKMEREAVEKLTIIGDLRKAIAEEQFALNFQPILNYDKRIIGAEALIRWPHPTKGLISPARFIPVAEESMLIRPIGEWVLKKAFRLWQEHVVGKGHKLYLSFNLSIKQFSDSSLIASIDRAVLESGLSPNYLQVELTESSFMEGIGKNIKKLELLKKKGIKISIDDFGTGYSSLSYLETLPIDTIKIDRSFITGIPSQRDSSPIAEIILDMANRLEKNVIIEGVEVEEQWNYLKDLHFHGGLQGFYFSKPLSIENFVEFIREHDLSQQPLSGQSS